MTYWADVDRVMMRRFEWGVLFSCSTPGDQPRGVHGVDPMASVRFVNKRSALRLIASAGGLLPLVNMATARAGLVACGPVAGALGYGAGPNGGVLMFCPENGIWVGKSHDGYVAGLQADRGWICKR